MSNTANQKIRNATKEANLFLWEVAARIGINDGNFSRKLRRELPEDEQYKILRIISELAAERKVVD